MTSGEIRGSGTCQVRVYRGSGAEEDISTCVLGRGSLLCSVILVDSGDYSGAVVLEEEGIIMVKRKREGKRRENLH